MPRNTQFLRTDNTKKRIISIRAVREQDNYPDLSYLGEYSDSPQGDCCLPGQSIKGPSHIDRRERGEQGRNELRYFNSGCGDPEYIEKDYERMDAYNRGSWFMYFIQAEATISINGVMQIITSGGIGGVESDSEESYLMEMEAEQMGELETILKDMGFTKAQINKAKKAGEA